jgi:DNA-binding transcriptional regulator YdaS (Cro superfamily)
MASASPSSESPTDALRRAVAKRGSQVAFARLIGVTQGAVSKWLREQKHLPDKHVLAVEAATGVPKEQLRPDLYPPETRPDLHARPDDGRDVLEPAR